MHHPAIAAHPGLDGADTTPSCSAAYAPLGQRPAERVPTTAVALVLVGSAAAAWGVVVAAGALETPVRPVPAVAMTTMAAAVMAATVCTILGRLTDDARLRWVAWGYGAVAAVALGGGLTPLGHVVLPAFAAAALFLPSRRWLRPALAAAFGLLALAALLEPAALGLPQWLDAQQGAGPASGWLLAGSAAWCVAATLLWMVRSGRRPTRPELWVSAGLLLVSMSAVSSLFADEQFTSLWWAGHALWAAHAIVPAVGLFAGLLHHVAALDRHDRALAARLNIELTDVLDGQTEITLDRQDREQRFDRVQSLIDTRALSVVLQPIYHLREGHLVGFEALSRFEGPPAQPPDVWFNDAMSVGSGVDLELVAIAAALPRLADVPDEAYLAVNVSPDTLASPRLASLLATLDVTRLVLEVTEHARIDDYEGIARAIDRLKGMGVRLAVDDAGAGFSSLRHIVRLEPAIIKLDMSLTRGIHKDPVRRSLAASLVAFADTNGIALVAEGIETEGELDQLRALGVTAGQGYLLCRPASFFGHRPPAHVGRNGAVG